MQSQIAQVRRFHRIVSQRSGTLDQSYLGQGRPLGEARLLFEIGREGCDIRTLRDRLGLDSGYFSRLLRALETQGLVATAPSLRDRRVRDLQLTDKGQAQVAIYDRLSNDLAASILSPLDDRQRQQLTTAMAQVERLLRAANVTLEVEAPDSVDARACVAAYATELQARFDKGFSSTAPDPTDDVQYRQPDGVFMVARLEGRAVGCGGLKRLEDTTGEIKRLWVASDMRGMGLGRRLLVDLENHARRMGLSRLCLDTNRALTEAKTLYLAQGYVEVARYNDNPHADHWFTKPL